MTAGRSRKLIYVSAPINRVETQPDGTLLVAGTAVTETPVFQVMPDGRRRRVVLDYSATKAASERYARNIREMHHQEAVGRAIEVNADDAKRSVSLTAFVSDGAPNTQKKVRDGTLRSYSIGCDPVSWHDEPDGDITRVTSIDWVETSLVDVGADPNTNDLILLTRGAHLEPGLTGREDAMSTKAAAAVETGAHKTTTKIGETEVAIAPDGTATVTPIVRAAVVAEPPPEPAKPPDKRPDVASTEALQGTGVNRFAVAMTAGLKREDEAMTEAAKTDEAPDAAGAAANTEVPEDGIANEADFMEAIRSMSHAKEPGAEKTKIKAAAKRLGLVDKLPRTWRTSRPELVRGMIASLERHMAGGNETDDLSCAIGLMREAGWLSQGVEFLLASELAEGIGGIPSEGGQVAILQGALASFRAGAAALKEFIADEASEGAVADGAMLESAAQPTMVRGLVALNRRFAAIEKKFATPPAPAPPAFTAEDAEQLASAMGTVFGQTTAPLSRALGDLDKEIKAVRGELDQVLSLPKPFGAARGVTQTRANGNGDGTEMEIRVLRAALSNASDPMSQGFLRNQIAIAEMRLPPR